MSNDKVAATFHGAGPGVDLVGALRASVDRARQNRREAEALQVDREREQELRAHIADLLTDVDHFTGCTAEPGMTNCPCLIGRLHFAIGTEQVAQ